MPSPPIRIAFCITELDPGGAERALVQLVTRLDRSRWEPKVFCLTGCGVLVDDLTRAGVPVVCIQESGRAGPQLLLKLVSELQKFQPQILQTYLFHANMVGRIAGYLARVPVIVSGIRVAEPRSRMRLWLDRATDWMVGRHVCVSSDVAEFSAKKGRLPRQKLVVIPNGVDAGRFANAEPADLSEFGISAGCRTILSVGRLDPQKAPLDLLAAAAMLFPEFPDLNVLLVGDGPQRAEIEQWIRDHGCAGRVHLAGRREDVPALLQAATCFVLPSVWEGMPNALLEAMAAAKPCVATQVEGVSEVMEPDRAGLVVPPRAPGLLADAIRQVLSDPVAAAAMGHCAQLQVREKFSWTATVAKYDALYEQLLPPGA